MISPQAQQEIAARAAGLYERSAEAAGCSTTPPADSRPDLHAVEALRAWMNAFSPGDAEAFARRLSWDGFDPEQVLLVLSGSRPMGSQDAPLPRWAAWFDRLADHSPRVADEWADGPLPESLLFPPQGAPPFLESWTPLLRAARQSLTERAGSAAGGVHPRVTASFERQLLMEVSSHSELAMLESFRRFIAAASTSAEACGAARAHAEGDASYRCFVSGLLREGFLSFFTDFPVVARLWATIADGWVSATGEFMQRLSADRELLGRFFGDGANPGALTAVEPAMSDPHNGRRRVVALTFESGLRLVYKPRDVKIEKVFGDLLAWAHGQGLEPNQRMLRVLPRDGYGWVEFASNEPFENVEEVRRYYRQSGGLICLAHMLRARDLHMENLVATRAGPVVVDLELLLQPVSRRVKDRARALGESVTVDDSCLASGLLGMVQTGKDGDVYDVGGLRGDGSGALSVAKRVWRDTGTAAVHYVEENVFTAPTGNLVVLGGEVQKPDAFADEVIDGFVRTYSFLMDRRGALVAPGGPLEAFASAPVRVIPRPTDQYAMLSHVLAQPKYQRDGAARSVAMDVLHRGLGRAASRPTVWPLVVEERRALEGLDIPCFTVRADDTTVLAGAIDAAPGYFVQSGLAAVFERLVSMSHDDLLVQQRFLSRALSQPVSTQFQSSLPHRLRHPAGGVAPDDLVAAAEWIGSELLERFVKQEDGFARYARGPIGRESGLAAHTLYSGTLGVAVFFSALAAVTGQARWADAARQSVMPLLRLLDRPDVTALARDVGIGACHGIGSIVYGLSACADLTGDTSLVGPASHAARLISGDQIDADANLDVAGGAAGAILALLALFGRTGDGELLRTAAACGDRLVANRVHAGTGRAWPSMDARLYVGFAHGAAGMAYALARLHEATGNRAFGEAAAAGRRFVAGLFSAAENNWPLAAPSGEDVGEAGRLMVAWCHGAPGIALGLVAGTEASREQDIARQVEAALKTTARSGSQDDHLCCGRMGRCDVLLTAGRHLRATSAIEAAGRIAGNCRGTGT
jgi:type 2 lantibiotic biosynthesis protein LanM